jgi:hypothetical protein
MLKDLALAFLEGAEDDSCGIPDADFGEHHFQEVG